MTGNPDPKIHKDWRLENLSLLSGLVQGKFVHVTSWPGLDGMLRDGCIKPNLGQFAPTWGEPSKEPYYYCQSLRGISLLDFHQNNIAEMIRGNPDMLNNVLSIITKHDPAVILIFDGNLMSSRVRRCASISEMNEFKYMLGVEVCHLGEIRLADVEKVGVLSGGDFGNLQMHAMPMPDSVLKDLDLMHSEAKEKRRNDYLCYLKMFDRRKS